MSYTLTGKIKVIEEPQVFQSGFSKREFVVSTPGNYPQDIKFELFKEKAEMINTFSVDQEITVHFDIRGNEYNGKYYVNLVAWKLEAAMAMANNPSGTEGMPPPLNETSKAAPVNMPPEIEEDLPF